MALNFTDLDYSMHLAMHTILAVDDEDIHLGAVRGIALANGFACEIARSPVEAWKKLSKNPYGYELLISDNSMPSINQPDSEYDYSTNEGLIHLANNIGCNEGLQLLRRIRNEQKLSSLDVIIYTGSDVEKQVEAFNAIYIQKQPHILNDILRERSELYRDASENPKEKTGRIYQKTKLGNDVAKRLKELE
ncbi:MAG: response regulator [Candidatus Woesearchaeota archaeon]